VYPFPAIGTSNSEIYTISGFTISSLGLVEFFVQNRKIWIINKIPILIKYFKVLYMIVTPFSYIYKIVPSSIKTSLRMQRQYFFEVFVLNKYIARHDQVDLKLEPGRVLTIERWRRNLKLFLACCLYSFFKDGRTSFYFSHDCLIVNPLATIFTFIVFNISYNISLTLIFSNQIRTARFRSA